MWVLCPCCMHLIILTNHFICDKVAQVAFQQSVNLRVKMLLHAFNPEQRVIAHDSGGT